VPAVGVAPLMIPVLVSMLKPSGRGAALKLVGEFDAVT